MIEVTPIAPLKAGDDSRRNWRTINTLADRAQNHGPAIASLQAAVARLSAPGAFARSHPFEIYQFPEALRESPAADDWRKVRVRSGTVFNLTNGTEIECSGTDGVTIPDHGDASATGDITCAAATAKYWIWIELTDTTAAIAHGATPPTWDPNHLPVGWVNTTDGTNKLLTIRQFIRTDLFICL